MGSEMCIRDRIQSAIAQQQQDGDVGNKRSKQPLPRYCTEISSSTWSDSFPVQAMITDARWSDETDRRTADAPALPSGSSSTTAASKVNDTAIYSTVSLLALGGPHVLCIMVHEVAGLVGTTGPASTGQALSLARLSDGPGTEQQSTYGQRASRWGTGCILQCGEGTCVSCVSFVPSSSTSMRLASGGMDGSIRIWHLTYAHTGGDDNDAGVGTVAETGSWTVLSPDRRPVHSIAAVAMIGDVPRTSASESDAVPAEASNCEFRPWEAGSPSTTASTDVPARLAMIACRGNTVHVLSLSPPETCTLSARQTGPNMQSGDAATTDALATRAWRVTCVATERHSHQVGAVYISQHCWVSVSVDGTALTGAQHITGGEHANADGREGGPTVVETRSLPLLQGSLLTRTQQKRVGEPSPRSDPHVFFLYSPETSPKCDAPIRQDCRSTGR